MPWWMWLFLGVALAAAGGGLIWAIFFVGRVRTANKLDARIQESVKQREAEEVEIQRLIKDRALKTQFRLEQELRDVADRRKRELEGIEDEVEREARRLADDPDALLARLDRIIGGSGD